MARRGEAWRGMAGPAGHGRRGEPLFREWQWYSSCVAWREDEV